MVNTELIKKRMEELNIDQFYVSERLKIAQSTLSLKMNNQRALTIEEMFALTDILKIKDKDIREFFLG